VIVISEPTLVRQKELTCLLAHDGSCVGCVFFSGMTRLSSAVIPLQPAFAGHGLFSRLFVFVMVCALLI
jgi:hypothetical protein